MTGQLYLDTGLDKEQTAINRVLDNQPFQRYLWILKRKEPYFLAFGGGKDSILTYDLTAKSGALFIAVYAQTGIDPPELVRFIRSEYPSVIMKRPQITMWHGIEMKGLPTRRKRWCCQYLKHYMGNGSTTITGIRWAESPRRKKYGEVSYQGKNKVVNPIIDWTNHEVWDYIKSNKLPYCKLYDEGFTRLGCLICPMTQRRNRLREAELYPKIKDAYVRANRKFYLRKEHTQKEADDYFEEWINYP